MVLVKVSLDEHFVLFICEHVQDSVFFHVWKYLIIEFEGTFSPVGCT